eukprot:UC1_evm1s188
MTVTMSGVLGGGWLKVSIKILLSLVFFFSLSSLSSIAVATETAAIASTAASAAAGPHLPPMIINSREKGGRRLNVIHLIADDLRPEISAPGFGQKVAQTPNIDRLASTGTVFARAYCQQAVCGPSRNSFMTGRRPHHTNVLGNSNGDCFRDVGIDGNGVVGANWTTLPEWFKKSGWNALGGGKTFREF